MVGRKPKPSALREVTGRKKRPGEPQPKGKAIKPAWLQEQGAKLWRKYAPELNRLGILTSVDAEMFAVWCSEMASYQERRAKGLTVSPPRLTQLRSLASMFGMEPSARARMAVPGGKEEKDPAEKFFRRCS